MLKFDVRNRKMSSLQKEAELKNYKVQKSVDDEEKLVQLINIEHEKVFEERKINLLELQKTVQTMMTQAQHSVECQTDDLENNKFQDTSQETGESPKPDTVSPQVIEKGNFLMASKPLKIEDTKTIKDMKVSTAMAKLADIMNMR